jgi:malonate transporter
VAAAFAIVLPVFVVILIGYAFGKSGRFNAAATKGLTDFTFSIAVPALLFRTVAGASFPAADAAAVWASFFGALLMTWALATMGAAFLLRRSTTDGAAITMSATYGNVVMLGIPLSYTAFGPEAGVTIAILMSIHTPLVWLAGSLHMALAEGGQNAKPLPLIVSDVAKDLARNPIILAVVLGLAWQLTGLGLNVHVDRVLSLLAQASAPCSLIALGLSLVSFEIKGQTPTLALILILKLIVMPALAGLLAFEVFGLDRVAAGVVVLFAAMPTGANAYLFASRYGKAVNSTSGSVALGTILAAPISAGIIWLMS